MLRGKVFALVMLAVGPAGLPADSIATHEKGSGTAANGFRRGNNFGESGHEGDRGWLGTGQAEQLGDRAGDLDAVRICSGSDCLSLALGSVSQGDLIRLADFGTEWTSKGGRVLVRIGSGASWGEGGVWFGLATFQPKTGNHESNSHNKGANR